jgi:hypothetical protein
VPVSRNQNFLSIYSNCKYLRTHRHRGEGHPSRPATPPYVRVRIRRFGGLSRGPHHHRGKPELSKVGVRQGNGQSG